MIHSVTHGEVIGPLHGPMGAQSALRAPCTAFCSAVVSVRGGIGAVEVHVLVAEEATVAVLCAKFS